MMLLLAHFQHPSREILNANAYHWQWRQDWTYQAPRRLEYAEIQTWRWRDLDEDYAEGRWTQCVYQVSDAPRYCGSGRWNHRYDVATWTSDRTWRPLPRREHTTRDDYNVLNAENRHTVTPAGWTHEQDNTKTLREGQRVTGTLVREFGFNEYRRIDGFDFSEAYAYWEATQDYWAAVRDAWQRRFTMGNGVYVSTPFDGDPIIRELFSQAAAVQDGEDIPYAAIEETLDTWVEPADQRLTTGR